MSRKKKSNNQGVVLDISPDSVQAIRWNTKLASSGAMERARQQIAKNTGSYLGDTYHRQDTLALPSADRDRIVLAADSHLPWYGNNHVARTLLEHTIQEGMAQNLSGFLGYPALSYLRNNGLINACISTTADEMTRKWIEIFKENDRVDSVSDEVKILEEANSRHQTQQLANEMVRFNELFGGCMVYIDTGAKDDELLTPLVIKETTAELQNFQRFTIVEPINVFPGYYESTDPLDPNYFEPMTYWVLGKRVHKSRLIKISSGSLPVILKPSYNFFGVPHAQILWDYVIHFQKCRIAAANGLTKFSRTFLKTDMASMLDKDEGELGLMTRLMQLSNTTNDSVTAIDFESEDIGNVNMPLAGVTDIVWQGLEMLCVANMSPAVKTLGISPSGFSATGESDQKNWEAHIASKQERDLRAPIEIMQKVLQVKYLKRIDPEINFKFVPISEDKLEDKAAYNERMLKVIGEAFDMGLTSEPESRKLIIEFPDSIFASLENDVQPDTAKTEGHELNAAALAEGGLSDVESTALNGAQVQALASLAAQVKSGELERDQAKAIILTAFPVDEAYAERIVGSQEIANTINPEQVNSGEEY